MQKQVHSSHPHFVMNGFPALIFYEIQIVKKIRKPICNDASWNN